MARHLQQDQLLAQGLLQLGGRETEPAGVKGYHVGVETGLGRLPAQKPAAEGHGVGVLVGAQAQADNGDPKRSAGLGLAAPFARFIGGILLNQQVGVVAAEAEAADRRRALAVPGLPRRGGVGHGEGGVLECVGQGPGAGGGGQLLVLHGRQGLDQSGDPRRRDQVAEVRLQRAQGDGGPAIDAAQGGDLGGVAYRGAGGVALDVLHLLRRQPGLVQGGAHGPHLPVAGRRQEAASAPVVGQAHAPDHPVDAVARRQGVVQPLQRHEGGAFRRDQAIGVAVEGPALPGQAQGVQGAEAHMQEQLVGGVHRSGQHQVRAAVLQPVAGGLDGVEPRGAGGVQRQRTPVQAEGARGQHGGRARHEPVQGMNLGVRRSAERPLNPLALDQAAERPRRIGQIAEHQAAALGGDALHPAQRLAGGVQGPAEHRIKLLDQVRVDDRGGIKLDGKRADIAAPHRPGVIGPIAAVLPADHPVHAHAPVARRRLGDLA